MFVQWNWPISRTLEIMRCKAVQLETTFELYSIIFYSEKPHSILGLCLILACPLSNTKPVNLAPNPPPSISKHLKQINCKSLFPKPIAHFCGRLYWLLLCSWYIIISIAREHIFISEKPQSHQILNFNRSDLQFMAGNSIKRLHKRQIN